MWPGIGDLPGRSGRETRSVELDKSEEVRVELKMGAGELRVRGGAAKLMEAGLLTTGCGCGRRCPITVAALDSGDIWWWRSRHGVHAGSNRYEWDLAFNNARSRWIWR